MSLSWVHVKMQSGLLIWNMPPNLFRIFWFRLRKPKEILYTIIWTSTPGVKYLKAILIIKCRLIYTSVNVSCSRRLQNSNKIRVRQNWKYSLWHFLKYSDIFTAVKTLLIETWDILGGGWHRFHVKRVLSLTSAVKVSCWNKRWK